MSVLYYLLMVVVSWGIGLFAFSQIIGAILNFKTRGPIMIVTMVIWLAIIGVTLWIVLTSLKVYIWGWVVGMIIAFVWVLKAKIIK